MKNLIKVFTIKKPHGIKGEVKVVGLINLKTYATVDNKLAFIKTGETFIPVTVVKVFGTIDKLVMRLKEYCNINDVIKFQGCDVYFKKDDVGDIPVLTSLIGYQVIKDDQIIGTVIDQLETKAHPILRIKDLQSDQIMLIPIVKEYVQTIDETTRSVILDKVI
ncbi:ribosome maturation factor RimM [Spiroplasma chrysopicola]|uniref:Ribosome maturation factor RimM n=1 Tax=Spiroplasma chrysopicola DF-1 TaxID=1276227 RepID=R4U0N0_9MOLU|nr:ribosome maturation factor RimM [Spiroplasma chrysopicola]AGM24822.1 16S rRNA-processing protein [Spiroplasma chrysopicola DF-1]